MAVKNLKLKINLSEMFGEKFPNDSDLRQAIGQEVIDKMVERTQKGRDVRGNKFKQYTAEYAAKKGVSRNKVNLTLTEDMLSAMDITEETPETITIAFDDELENAKAFNHNTGDTLPKREFFGIQKKEREQIAKKFASQVRDVKSGAVPAVTRGFVESEADRIIDQIFANLQSQFRG